MATELQIRGALWDELKDLTGSSMGNNLTGLEWRDTSSDEIRDRIIEVTEEQVSSVLGDIVTDVETRIQEEEFPELNPERVEIARVEEKQPDVLEQGLSVRSPGGSPRLSPVVSDLGPEELTLGQQMIALQASAAQRLTKIAESQKKRRTRRDPQEQKEQKEEKEVEATGELIPQLREVPRSSLDPLEGTGEERHGVVIPVEEPQTAQERRDAARAEDEMIDRQLLNFTGEPEELVDDEEEYGTVFDLPPESLDPESQRGLAIEDIAALPARAAQIVGRPIARGVFEALRRTPLVSAMGEAIDEATGAVSTGLQRVRAVPSVAIQSARASVSDLLPQSGLIEEIKRGGEEKKAPLVELSVEERLNDIDEIRLILNARHVEPFSSNSFNKNIIRNTIRDNVDEDGNIQNIALLKSNFKDIMEIGFKQTLPTDDPGNLSMQAISTLSTAIHEAVKDHDINDSDVLHRIAQEAVNELVGRTALPSMLSAPISDVDKITETIFQPEIRRFRNMENLDVTQIRRVKRDFDRFLNQMRMDIISEAITNPSVEFNALSNYLENNISNEQLRNILLREVDITRKTVQNFQKDFIVGVPPSIVPRTLSQGMLIGTPQREQLISNVYGNIIEDASQISEEFKLSEIGPNTAAAQQAQNILTDRIREGINAANIMANSHGIRVKIPGQAVRPAFVSPRNSDGSSKNMFEMLLAVEEMRNMLQTSEITFFRNPSAIDEASGVTEEKFFTDISRARVPTSSAKRRPRHKRTTVPKPPKETKLGNIRILATEGSNIKELDIPAGSKTSDVVKLATILTMETGLLEDINGKLLLRVQKNQVDVTKIVTIILEQLNINAGHDIKLLYLPEHSLGGHFLDGFLSSLHERDLVSKGGSLKSNGFIIHNPFFPLSQFPISMFTRFRKFL